MLKLGYTYNDMYDLTMSELLNTIEQRKKGLAYEIWKLGNLSQMLEKYPENPEKACPELYPPKKTIEMPDFLKKKYYERSGAKYE